MFICVLLLPGISILGSPAPVNIYPKIEEKDTLFRDWRSPRAQSAALIGIIGSYGCPRFRPHAAPQQFVLKAVGRPLRLSEETNWIWRINGSAGIIHVSSPSIAVVSFPLMIGPRMFAETDGECRARTFRWR